MTDETTNTRNMRPGSKFRFTNKLSAIHWCDVLIGLPLIICAAITFLPLLTMAGWLP